MRPFIRFVLTLVLCLVMSVPGVHLGIMTARAAETGTWTQLPLYGSAVLGLAIDPYYPLCRH
jgi:hypothetical protein